jgi:hypothetical protein
MGYPPKISFVNTLGYGAIKFKCLVTDNNVD